MKTKKVSFSLLVASLVMLAMPVSAQETNLPERDKSVFLEIGGPSNFAGINYEARFKKGSPWEYRVGLAFAYASNSNFLFDDYNSMRAWTMPLGVNYLIGHKRSQLELGAGINVGLYNLHYTEWKEVTNPTNSEYTTTFEAFPKTDNCFEYYLFANVGYRHVSKKGFLFRVGITPAVSFGGKHDFKGFWLAPYISFGKAF
jgi:hypothetical protein